MTRKIRKAPAPGAAWS